MPKRICREVNCNVLVDGGYCSKHKREPKPENRPSAFKRGYTGKWRKVSKFYLAKHPLCVECEKQGLVTLATDVDHIKPHKGDKTLFWDKNNWQALCHSCHSKKTVKEANGGWY